MKTNPRTITLYDTPLSQQNGYAPNMWRVRLILNYKKLNYRTQWVEIPDIPRTMRQIGAPSTKKDKDGRPIYVLPVIVDPSRNPPVILSNPSQIAEYLEASYPARPIFPDGSKALQTLFVHYITEVWARPLVTVMVSANAARLSERSQQHLFGGPPQQLSAAEYERGWAQVLNEFNFLSAVLEKNSGEDGDGVIVSGHELTYSDFAICSFLIWIERVSPNDGWLRVRDWHNHRWARLLDRVRSHMDVL